MVSKSSKNYFLFQNTYIFCLSPTEEKGFILGRVYCVKLACLVRLKIKIGFGMCLSGLGPITGMTKALVDEKRAGPCAHLHIGFLSLPESCLLCGCADGLYVPAVLPGFLPAFAALEQLTDCLLGAHHETFLLLVNGSSDCNGISQKENYDV